MFENTLLLTTAVFVALAAYFRWRETLEDEDHKNSVELHDRLWRLVSNTKWWSLPTAIIDRIFRNTLTKGVTTAEVWATMGHKILLFTVPWLGLIAFLGYLIADCEWYIVWGSGIVCFGLAIFPSKYQFKWFDYIRALSWLFGTAIIVAYFLTILFEEDSFDIHIPLIGLLFIYGGAMSFGWLFIAFPVRVLGLEKWDDPELLGPFQAQSMTTVTGATIGLGAIWTYLALYFGHKLVPGADIPIHANAFLANLAADMTTVFISLTVLRWASMTASVIRIPIAVSCLIGLGGMLSFFSVKVSVWGRSYDLDFVSCLNVIFAKSPDGMRFELGPLFWLAHTTFIPLLILIFIITIAWLAKLSLIPPRLFLGISHKHSNPNKLTSTFFLLLATICGIGAAILKSKSG